ncbi:MAG: 4-(cytidine 5'-diphospho)-2-C-methyl-D-erythritol kinase [Dyella sp.]|uniref:4-(cytidine 5'-diphospho)-2-C-methyl-D-erythritol kinase n=1 Tax=Dyella sp. TaxID=1869338 RepID=UPI003F8211AB
MTVRIERARPSQVDALCAIERAAVQLFRGHPAWTAYAAMAIPPELLHGAVARGLVWVAMEQGEPVGFVWLDDDLGDEAVGIGELDVLPSHGRRGIGAALLEHACAWARAAGYRQVHLGTLVDVPWNAPFYAKHGFSVVDKRDPAFAEVLARDRENGFPDDLRVFMSRPLPPLAADEWSVWPAPAKLNLFLRITGRRPDGYHELQTVFRLLDWGDELRLRVRADGIVQREGELPGVPADEDITVRAARLLQTRAGITLGADIGIDKRIPMGGGLGGGSSDAATVLVALNHLWRAGLDEDALAKLGRQLGADVPVFVRGRSAWAEGIGERLQPIDLPRRHYVVLDPREHVPTAALFQAPELTRNAPRATISSFVSGETAENAFEPVVRARHPRVDAALEWLGGFGRAKLSGSGGCVFLETPSELRALSIAVRCPDAWSAQVAAGADRSMLHRSLARFQGAPQPGQVRHTT